MKYEGKTVHFAVCNGEIMCASLNKDDIIQKVGIDTEAESNNQTEVTEYKDNVYIDEIEIPRSYDVSLDDEEEEVNEHSVIYTSENDRFTYKQIIEAVA